MKAKIKSLQEKLKTAEGEKSVKILNSLCKHFQYSDLEQAFEYGNQALSLSQKLEFRKGIANSLVRIGTLYYFKGDYPQALDYQLKALDIRNEIFDQSGIAESYNALAPIYFRQGDVSLGLEYLLKSLKIYEN